VLSPQKVSSANSPVGPSDTCSGIGYSVAVLMTCHNRKESTLACLKRVFSQRVGEKVRLHAFVVDDGSTDGTSEAVMHAHNEVSVLRGDGSMYWTGGMRMAIDAARRKGFDFYVWLNDDTMLYPDAIGRLLATYEELKSQERRPAIVAGSIRDPVNGEFRYGGSVHVSRWHPLRFAHVAPDLSSAKQCDVFNGNCVLVPHEVVELVGNLHAKLIHASGDYEYGLRARKKGVDVWIAPGYLGECSRNPIAGTWLDPELSLWSRYKHFFGVKGQPVGQRFRYYAAHGGPLWPILFILVYFRPLVRFLKDRRLSRIAS
jgi:GT2 family glycosyltransferase